MLITLKHYKVVEKVVKQIAGELTYDEGAHW